MTRYINADALIKRIQDEHKFGSLMLSNMIDDMPTADVVEVKRGRWIEDRLCSTIAGTYEVRRCSVCGEHYEEVGYDWNYCPNCGTKMC